MGWPRGKKAYYDVAMADDHLARLIVAAFGRPIWTDKAFAAFAMAVDQMGKPNSRA